jgi:hypothetical protein
MTARTAAISSPVLAHILEAFPDYGCYGNSQVAQEAESPYRLAMGQLLKEWGDRLLDVLESQPSSLTRTQAITIDTLVRAITANFEILNSMDPVAVDPRDRRRIERLQRCDSTILQLLDEALHLTSLLRQREFSGSWLMQNARPLYRRLRRLQRELAMRNALLVPSPEGVRSSSQSGSFTPLV